METIELSLSPKYVNNWGLSEAVREILQNALDCQSDGADVDVTYASKRLTIATYGSALDKSTLLLGESGKSDGRYIGKYGEGYKLALLVLTRLKHPVSVYTGGEKWTPVFRESEVFGEPTLQLDIEPCGDYPEDCAAFAIEGIEQHHMLGFRSEFIALERFLGRDIGACRESEYGTVLLGEEFAGEFYVSGLHVQTDTEFKYGYDFKTEFVNLDRDRKAINYYDLKELTARALTACGDAPMLVAGIKERIVDLSNHETVLDTISDEQSQNFKHHYFEKHDLEPDTFVGTAKMIEISESEHVHEDNKIVARIIAKADDKEDEFDEIEHEVEKANDRDAAITAFNKSSYKKLLVWMLRQTRISQKAKNEFIGIIDQSYALRFHGKSLIQNELIDLAMADIAEGGVA